MRLKAASEVHLEENSGCYLSGLTALLSRSALFTAPQCFCFSFFFLYGYMSPMLKHYKGQDTESISHLPVLLQMHFLKVGVISGLVIKQVIDLSKNTITKCFLQHDNGFLLKLIPIFHTCRAVILEYVMPVGLNKKFPEL